MAKMLAAAIEYAALGWRVFPIYAVTSEGCECGDQHCGRPGKHPSLKGWPKEATTDERKIRTWWAEKPDRGIGIATGEGSGLTVLDVDGEEGVESLTKLAEGVGMPPTPVVTTRPGRYHYYFRYAPGVKSQAGKIGLKLDSRGDGGYVVAPPSRHAAGGLYSWLQPPSKVALSDWPAFLGTGKVGEGGPKKRGRPSKEGFNTANPAEIDKLKEALGFVDPDDEERWVQVGWILGRAFHQSDGGFAIYSAWAARSRKYDAKRTRGHYYERSKEVRGGELKTTSSLYSWAIEGGWVWEDPEEAEERKFHIYDNPFNEGRTVEGFIVAAAAAESIFEMDRRLVRIVHYGSSGKADHDIERDPTAYIVFDHDSDTLAVEFGKISAYWVKRAKGVERGAFPRRSIQTFMACRQYSHEGVSIKRLLAFVSHPTIRQDGSLLVKVGYDPASQLFLTSEVRGLTINPKLSQKAARAAMALLMEPFSEYPWASPVDRAVFAASLFTVGLRHLFDVAPLFAFSSPKHGSGKTQLAECVSRLWYGITLSKATWTPNPEEMEKRIAAFLLAGDRIVCLDNVTEGMKLEDSTLNKVLTSRRNTFRLLGRTERVELTNEATWFATGNQLLLAGDISRRALLCYIDARVVDPSARTFTIENLPAYVMSHRAELMGAALSIVSSWIAAGRPHPTVQPRAYGSFTEWYAMLRPLLLWVGEEDIAINLSNIVDQDIEGMALEIFANAFRKVLPPDGSMITAQEILKLFTKDNDLRSAFMGTISHDKEPNLLILSRVLNRTQNKIFISDNPGEAFTIVTKKDKLVNIWRWGVEDR